MEDASKDISQCFTPIEWRAICSKVAEEMRKYVMPFVTPVSKVLQDEDGKDVGELDGTGSYIENRENRFLITNEHVARDLEITPLAHQFHGSDDVYRILNPFVAISHPNDVALSRIGDSVWSHAAHQARAIPINMCAKRHNPVDRELLFFYGYSGERSTFLFNTLISRGTPYVTQQHICPPQDMHPYHFALDYRGDRAESVDGTNRGLPIPKGFSGSLVWNTKWVESHYNGTNWSPELAEVTGIVWGWPSSNACLFATRIEHMLEIISE